MKYSEFLRTLSSFVRNPHIYLCCHLKGDYLNMFDHLKNNKTYTDLILSTEYKQYRARIKRNITIRIKNYSKLLGYKVNTLTGSLEEQSLDRNQWLELLATLSEKRGN